MMALESLNCSPSMSTMGTLRQSLENFISDLSSGLTSTVRYGTPRASRYPLTLQQKGHTSYWYSTSSILGSDAGAAGRAVIHPHGRAPASAQQRSGKRGASAALAQ